MKQIRFMQHFILKRGAYFTARFASKVCVQLAHISYQLDLVSIM